MTLSLWLTRLAFFFAGRVDGCITAKRLLVHEVLLDLGTWRSPVALRLDHLLSSRRCTHSYRKAARD